MLVDRSGSMASTWNETIGSLNAYIKELANDTDLFVAVFDSNGYDVVRNGKVGELSAIKPNEFEPRGGTPLLDATARIMYRAFDDDHAKTVLVIMTDGEENSSQKYKKSDVTYLTQKMEAKEWQVIFLGANFDKVGDQATQYLGLASTKFTNRTTANFASSMADLGVKSMSYATGKARSIEISDEEKAKYTS